MEHLFFIYPDFKDFQTKIWKMNPATGPVAKKSKEGTTLVLIISL
jgi:hypothetical protein